ncbi:leucine-rich repeat neuronal protein 1 [Gouania willdenowi]|uniref:Leucine-rich repeat neuronal protein 1-like n=1 Tax=Gouania willdenowi TaxID=441366 RepID=A0A8C5EXC6_GOUWI|nr:leucine-rich repeat neuronal protein 1-like [Gouania willdenowi]
MEVQCIMGITVLSVPLILSMMSSVCAEEGGVSLGMCPPQCVCETRPWFTPQSVYHEARTIDCNELQLQRAPQNLTDDTQVLLLQSNNISSITDELQALTNLTELDLSQNHFIQVSSMGLTSLGCLVTLYLEENLIVELQDFSLRNLSSLEELYINHNRISSIRPKAFAGLSKLLRLHLNSNRLLSIDSRWFQSLPSLEILMIGENPILGLEEKNFLPLSSLHSLVLAGMGLTSVPSDAFVGLEYLESLSFYDNRLRSVPRDALRVLPNLKFLDLNRNPVRRIQQGDFQDFAHLEELSLNNMEELLMVERRSFHNLPELSKLELCNNPRLSYIQPQAFSGLPALRTLMLHTNQLSLLSPELLSLPSLEEVSLYSNPLRCDCLLTWRTYLGNQSQLTVLQASVTLCASPPALIGRELREVAWGWEGGGANSCLPHISPHALPPSVNVSEGQPITLECWADADPAPQFYWITPTGDKVSSEARALPIMSSGGRGLSRKRKHHVSELGALVIEHTEASDAGMYTCVSWNEEGADTKSVSVIVVTSGRSYEPMWVENSSSAASPLVVLAKAVHSQSVLLQWSLFPSNAASGFDSAPSLWTGASVYIHNDHISYTTQVALDVQEFNVTHLLPSTEYHVCLTVSSGSARVHTSCLNVTTRAASFCAAPVVSRQGGGEALAAALGSVLAMSVLAALLLSYTRRRVQQHSNIPLNELYPPLITLWEGEAERDEEGAHAATKTCSW